MKRPWARHGVWLYSYEQARSTLFTPIMLWGGFILGLLALAFGILILVTVPRRELDLLLIAAAAIAYGVITFPIGLTILIRKITSRDHKA